MENEKWIELVNLAKNGDEEAFNELYRAKAKSILFQTSYILSNSHDAEDAAQEIVILMHRNIGQLREPEHFTIWLQRIISRVCTTYIRRKMKRMEFLNIEDFEETIKDERLEFLPEEYVNQKELQKELNEIIKKLPEGRKRALLMYYYEEMSYVEIAETLQISISAATSAVTKARKTIKEELEKKAGEEKKILKAYGFTAVPVLTQMLRSLADSEVPHSKVTEFIGNCDKELLNKQVEYVETKITNTKILRTLFIFLGSMAGVCFVASYSLTSNRQIVPPKHDPQIASLSPIETSDPQVEVTILGNDETGSPKIIIDQSESNQTLISGIVEFKDNQEEEINKFFDHLHIYLVNKENEIVAETLIGQNGKFSFEEMNLIDQHYRLKIELEDHSKINFIGSDKNYEIPLKIEPNQSMFIKIEAKWIPTLTGGINFINGVCECNHVNPQQIIFVTSNELPVMTKWQIIRVSDNEVIEHGEGSTISEPIETLIQEKKDGLYTVRFDCIDSSGNTAIINQIFMIDSNPIDINQYQ